MHARIATVLATAVLLGAATPAGAEGPAFDCAKAQGEVPKLVCSDAGLAALDRKLDGVYREAVARAKGPLIATLRAEQRGWLKGRDECWKATAATPDFITASWTVASPRECTEAHYRLRTAELQAVWRLLPPKTVSYACNGQPANELVASFFDTDPPAARVERGDRTVTVYLVPAAGGATYEGRNVTFSSNGTEASASWMNEASGETEALKCLAR